MIFTWLLGIVGQKNTEELEAPHHSAHDDDVDTSRGFHTSLVSALREELPNKLFGRVAELWERAEELKKRADRLAEARAPLSRFVARYHPNTMLQKGVAGGGGGIGALRSGTGLGGKGDRAGNGKSKGLMERTGGAAAGPASRATMESMYTRTGRFRQPYMQAAS
jgi:hypothetical protein